MAFASRKIGRSREHQASSRKVLEIEACAAHEAAVPPLSPPVWTMTTSLDLEHDGVVGLNASI